MTTNKQTMYQVWVVGREGDVAILCVETLTKRSGLREVERWASLNQSAQLQVTERNGDKRIIATYHNGRLVS